MVGGLQAPGGFQRKEKRMLTFIPEKSKSIEFRFTFVLIGMRAKEVALNVVHSEIAENYVPTAMKVQDTIASPLNRPEHSIEEIHDGSAPAPNGAEANKEPGSPRVRLGRGSVGGRASIISPDSLDALRCFCPLGSGVPSASTPRKSLQLDAGKMPTDASHASIRSQKSDVENNPETPGGTAPEAERLCRVQFRTVLKFSDSMPAVPDENTGRNTAFVFLVDYAPVKPDDADPWEEVPTVSSQLSDLEMRLMEHRAIDKRWRPSKFSLLLNHGKVSDGDETIVEEWQHKHGVDKARSYAIDGMDDSELFEAMQDICERMATAIHSSPSMRQMQSEKSGLSRGSGSGPCGGDTQRSKGCWPCRRRKA